MIFYSFKAGVSPDGLKVPLRTKLQDIGAVYHKLTYQIMRITSTTDGKHMEGSKHYNGGAIDIGIRSSATWQFFPIALRRTLVEEISALLGHDYDVVLEDDHIHIEYDPKVST